VSQRCIDHSCPLEHLGIERIDLQRKGLIIGVGDSDLQWTPRGAHLLLQTRVRTLDGTLRSMFARWFPGLANDNSVPAEQAAA
jgi:hypothetical protein